jgi:hypothetical protein
MWGKSMKAVVVYESLWGNTAAIARAIAEGLFAGAHALSTAEALAVAVAGSDLVVAGAPVHSLSLPTDASRESARTGGLGPGKAPPDLAHPPMRTWLQGLARGSGRAAALDTRVEAWYGRGALPLIPRDPERAGYRRLTDARGLLVSGHRIVPTASGVLRPGEIDRARQWGADLARMMD